MTNDEYVNYQCLTHDVALAQGAVSIAQRQLKLARSKLKNFEALHAQGCEQMELTSLSTPRTGQS